MQKKLIALAIAGLSGAAFAQSNVTIYGVMDATYDNVSSNGASSPFNTATSAASLPGRGRTTFNSSYIGFKGVEPLGNGLAVAFQIETGIGENPIGSFGGPSTGNTGGTAGVYGWANRDTYVGLAAPWGTVAFGNLTGPTRGLGAAFDVNSGDTGIGSNAALLGKLGGGSGAGYFDQRVANAIAYISPNFGGFSGVIGYLPNESRGSDAAQGRHACVIVATGVIAVSNTAAACAAGQVPVQVGALGQTTQNDMSAWTFGLNYANGPFTVGLSYTEAKDSNSNSTGSGFGPATFLANTLAYGVNTANAITAVTNATPLQKVDNTRLGFKWDFGQGTIGALWDRTKANVGAGYGFDAVQTVWYIPFTFNIGNGKIIAQYGKANNVSGSLISAYQGVAGGLCAGFTGGKTSCDFSASNFTLGYEYAMSKRTTLKALYSQINNGKDAGYDFLYGVSAPNTTAYGATGVPAGSDPRGISLGIRHSF
jgi:predicted porin